MNTRLFRRSVFSALTALFLAAPSVADGPEIVREMNPFNIPVVACGDPEADGFLVYTKGWERDTFKWWYDEFGDPLRLQWNIQITESEYYNGTDPDKTVSQGKKGVGENAMIRIDFVNGIAGDEHNSGAQFRLTIPGIGHVFLSVGTWEYDASEDSLVHHGPDIFADGESGLALCEALE